MKHLLTILILSFFVITGFAQVSGTIQSDTTWTAGDPVLVTGTVTIPSGKTLTIEPGAVVKFSPGTSLIVAGKLVAQGTSDNLIELTASAESPENGDWGRVEFQNTGNVGSVFSYVKVLFAGNGGSAIFYKTGAFSIPLQHVTVKNSAGHGVDVRSSSPVIKHSVFRENYGFGLFSDLFSTFKADSSVFSMNTAGGIRIPVNSGPEVTNSFIDSNKVGIYMDAGSNAKILRNKIRKNETGIDFASLGSTQPEIKLNLIAGNTVFGFKNQSTTTVKAEWNYWGDNSGPYHPYSNRFGQANAVSDYVDYTSWMWEGAKLPVTEITANIAGSNTWSSGVYWIKNDVTLTTGSSLTIDAGVVVKFSANARLIVNGTLDVNGTVGNEVVFTSYADDGAGGDSNGDSTTVGPNRGDWEELVLSTNSTGSDIENAIFRFGGNSSVGYPATVRIENITLTVTRVSVSFSSRTGFRTQNSTVNFQSIVSSDNNEYGLMLDGASTVTIDDSRFEKNGYAGINQTGWNNGNRSRISSLTNSKIKNNGYDGVYMAEATGIHTITGNEFMGNGRSGMHINNSQDGNWTIQNNTFNNNVRHGLVVHSSTHIPAVTNNDMSGNGQVGLVVTKSEVVSNTITNNQYPVGVYYRVGSVFISNTFTGNTYNKVFALMYNTAYTNYGLIDTLHSNPATGISAYHALSDLSVASGTKLVIEPGTVIKFGNTGHGFTATGELVAVGTTENPIIFTSFHDQNAGGKTTPDGVETKPARANWYNLYIDNANVLLENVQVRYAGYSYGGFRFSGRTYVNQFTNLTAFKNGADGVTLVNNTKATFEGLVSDSSQNSGLYGDPQNVDITIRNSKFRGNGHNGIYIDGYAYDRNSVGSAIRELSNSIISGNARAGVRIIFGKIPQTYVGNTIENNGWHGIANFSPLVPDSSIQYIGNTFTNNFYEGILTSAAKIIDNTITGNYYPIGNWGTFGNIYKDQSGVDGNTINSNGFNAIGIVEGEFAIGEIKNSFPLQVPSNVYVAGSLNLDAGDTLDIPAGTKIKMAAGSNWTNNGVIRIWGTQEEPVIITSYRDHLVGGKTNASTDTVKAKPGDWNRFRILHPESVINNLNIRFGGKDNESVRFEGISYAYPVNGLKVSHSYNHGILVAAGGQLLFENCAADSSRYSGLYLDSYKTSGTNTDVSVRHSRFRGNGNYGIGSEHSFPTYFGGAIRELSHSLVEGNGYTGVLIGYSNIPQSYINNRIVSNAGHGLYIRSKSNSIDTLLLISGNYIGHNSLSGIVSSRALIIDDSLVGNKWPIGLTGTLSQPGTSQENGSIYSGNVIEGNEFNRAISVQDEISGKIGFGRPDTSMSVFAVRSSILVRTGSSLEVAPGSIFKFIGNYYFDVQGQLLADGDFDKKIVFTSMHDDAFGGDYNKDSTSVLPASSNWNYLYLNGPANDSSLVRHLILRFADYGLYINSSSPVVDSSFFSNNTYGIYAVHTSATVTANEIHSNKQWGLYFQGNNLNPTLNRNNIYNNPSGGLYVYHYQPANNHINAVNNYWGDETGPKVERGPDLNLSGLGNRIYPEGSTVVDYRPFYFARSGVLLGDVSENGAISAFDASLVLQHAVSMITLTPNQQIAADVTSDGSISAFDASYILRYVVGLVTGFPGLGKQSAPEIPENPWYWSVENVSAGVYKYHFHVAAGLNIYGADLRFKPDPSIEAKFELVTVDNKNLLVLMNKAEGSVLVSVASTQPVNEEGILFSMVVTAESSELNGGFLSPEKIFINEKNLMVPTDVEEENPVPVVFSLDQNYPNPFNPSTTIRFALPVASAVEIRVYNLLGQTVATVLNERKPAGYQQVTIQAGSWTSGVYFYEIMAIPDNGKPFRDVKKMILVK